VCHCVLSGSGTGGGGLRMAPYEPPWSPCAQCPPVPPVSHRRLYPEPRVVSKPPIPSLPTPLSCVCLCVSLPSLVSPWLVLSHCQSPLFCIILLLAFSRPLGVSDSDGAWGVSLCGTPRAPSSSMPFPSFFRAVCYVMWLQPRAAAGQDGAPSERTDPGERMSARAPDSDLEKKKKVSHV